MSYISPEESWKYLEKESNLENFILIASGACKSDKMFKIDMIVEAKMN